MLPPEPVALRVERLAPGGEGLSSWNGEPVFVENAAPGDEVMAHLSRRGKALVARCEQVVEPGPDRRVPACALAGKCGGCQWLHLTERMQLAAKQERLQAELERIGGISRDAYRLRTAWAADPPLAHRRRATLHVGRDGLFFLERGSHEPVLVESCPALVESLSRKLPALSALLGPAHARLDEVRLLAQGESCAVALMLPGAVKDRDRTLALAVQRLGFKGVVLAPNTGTPELLGAPTLRALAPGAPDVPLYLRPDVFAQAHEPGNAELVIEMLSAFVGRSERGLELFGGNGNFTFALVGQFQEVWMVEESKLGLALARRSADEARLSNLRLVLGDAEKVARGLAREGQRFPNLLVDPPRAGFPAIAEIARALGVERIVYVACEPASLARDARHLVEAGYMPQTLRALDLFPQTRHIEAVMAFSR